MKIPTCQHQFDRLGGKCLRCGVAQRELVLGPLDDAPATKDITKHAEAILAKARKELSMHYRNGREAKNGDKLVKLDDKGNVVSFGVLHSAVPGNDYCNGNIAAIQPPNDYACMVDCLHIEDVAALLKEKGLEKRPAGK